MGKRIDVATPAGPAWIDLEEPTRSPRSLLVLGHGAGGGVNTPDLNAVTTAAVTAGMDEKSLEFRRGRELYVSVKD